MDDYKLSTSKKPRCILDYFSVNTTAEQVNLSEIGSDRDRESDVGRPATGY